jgi:hypothetical protein
MVPESLLHFTEVIVALVATVIIVVFIVILAPAIISLLKGKIGRVRNRVGHCHLRSERKESSKNVDERFHFEKK